MKIEHVAMYIKDLIEVRDFFVKYLGAVSNDGYHNKKTGFRQAEVELCDIVLYKICELMD